MTIYEKQMSIMADAQYLAKDDRVEFEIRNIKPSVKKKKVTSIMRAELGSTNLLCFQ